MPAATGSRPPPGFPKMFCQPRPRELSLWLIWPAPGFGGNSHRRIVDRHNAGIAASTGKWRLG